MITGYIPDSISSQKRVYIYDEIDSREIIADLIKTINTFDDEKGETIGTKTKYELSNITFYSAGELFSEILSIDDNAIKKSIKDAMNSNGVYTTILPRPFEKFGLLEDSEIIYPMNCISTIREFIVLSENFSDGTLTFWKNALYDFLLAWDSIPEYCQEIRTNDIYEGCYWEETNFFYPMYANGTWNSPNPFDLEFDSSKLRDKLPVRFEKYNNMEKSSNEFPNFSLAFSKPEQLIFASLELCLSHNIAVKKCKNCGKYFVPQNRSDTLYCDRKAPQDEAKTCKEYGARQAWRTTLKDNESAGLYRKIYMSKQMLCKRNPDVKEYTESFEKYKDMAKKWKANVKSGVKSEADYLEWLKAVKEKKVL